MTELAPNAVILHHPMSKCDCGAPSWILVTATLSMQDDERASGISSVWDCLRCGYRMSVGVAAPRVEEKLLEDRRGGVTWGHLVPISVLGILAALGALAHWVLARKQGS